ncbi:hypothetical protein [Dactylosporangium darangshiense]
MTRHLNRHLLIGLFAGLLTALAGMLLTQAPDSNGVTVIGHATVVSCNR